MTLDELREMRQRDGTVACRFDGLETAFRAVHHGQDADDRGSRLERSFDAPPGPMLFRFFAHRERVNRRWIGL